MACSMKINVLTCCSNENNFKTWPFAPCPINFKDSKFMGKSVGLSTDQRSFSNDSVNAPVKFSVRDKSFIMDIQAQLVADILSRIPIKSIVHCRCVSKTWLAILSEPYFVDLHLPRSPTGLIVHISNPPHEVDILGELDEKTDHHVIHYDTLIRFHLGLGFEYNVLLLCDTVNGLVFLWNYQDCIGYISNSITREYILLPDQEYDITSYTIVTNGFGYVEASNEYKVVSLYMDTDTDKSECKIYTLGTGMWRSLGHLTFSVISVHNGIHVSGNLHWLTNDPKDTRSEMVCTFDLEKRVISSDCFCSSC